MSRGGGPKRGRRLPGAEFSWGTEPGAEPDTAPQPLFPKYEVPRPLKLSERDLSHVEYYRSLRESLHDGPFYAILSARPSNNKDNVSARAQFDPFQGMATYGQRYMKKARALPKLNAVPFDMQLFPKELWSTLDPKYVGMKSGAANGFMPLSKSDFKRGFEDEEEDDDDGEEGKRKKRKTGDDEDEGSDAGGGRKGEEALDDEEEEGEEEIVDDDFDDDEDEMGGDYNAEQYFDGGDELGDGFEEGGGGDNDFY